MEPMLTRRQKILGWGNALLALAIPVRLLFVFLQALQVFTPSWAPDGYVLTTLIASGLGFLTGSSGWGILKGRPWATRITCIAGGLTLGYIIRGIFVMVTLGADRQLLILIRHGSPDWWNWSISHFQNSAVLEFPLLIWWVYGIGTVLRGKLPGAPESLGSRVARGIALVLGCSLMGAVLREFQILIDTNLYSTR